MLHPRFTIAPNQNMPPFYTDHRKLVQELDFTLRILLTNQAALMNTHFESYNSTEKL
jgi:hypothetical protein